jgi:hypothetical protein
MAIVVGATSQKTLYLLEVPLLSAGVTSLAYSLALTFFCVRQKASPTVRPGRPFNLKTTLVLAGTITVILIGSAAVNASLAEKGLIGEA